MCHCQATIDMLKIDVEFYEWAALEAMLADPASLRRVKQLALELHTRELPWVGGATSAADFTQYWLLLRGLDALHFKIWHYAPNYCCRSVTCCGMVYFINTDYRVG